MIHQFGIHLKVRDINRSFVFYKLFGFRETFGLGDKTFLDRLDRTIPKVKESYNGVVFQIGDALLEIADGHIAVKPEVFREPIPSSKISAMIYVDSISKIVSMCKKNSIRLAVKPKTFYWGTREVVVKDPDGFILVFIERLKKESMPD